MSDLIGLFFWNDGEKFIPVDCIIVHMKSGDGISGEILRRMCDYKRVETIEAHEMQNHALTKSFGLVGIGPDTAAFSSYGCGLCSLIMSVLFNWPIFI